MGALIDNWDLVLPLIWRLLIIGAVMEFVGSIMCRVGISAGMGFVAGSVLSLASFIVSVGGLLLLLRIFGFYAHFGVLVEALAVDFSGYELGFAVILVLVLPYYVGGLILGLLSPI